MLSLFKRKTDSDAAERARIGREVGARLDATPGLVRLPAEGVQAYCGEDYLDAASCAHIITLIDGGRRPSTVLSDRPEYGYRTSESCDLDRWADDVQPIDTGLAELLGIDPVYGETMQGQRYAPGQHFRAHHDYFFERESYWQRVKEGGGQRTWTAMIYLNDVEEGGATWFPSAGIRVLPRRGLVLIWNNMDAAGMPNIATLHEGMPVVTGVKYVVTKWFRERRWMPDYKE